MEIIAKNAPSLSILSDFERYADEYNWCTKDKSQSYSPFGTVKLAMPNMESSYSVVPLEDIQSQSQLPPSNKKYCFGDVIPETSSRITIKNVTDFYIWLIDLYINKFANANDNILQTYRPDEKFGTLTIFPRENLQDQILTDEVGSSLYSFQFIPA